MIVRFVIFCCSLLCVVVSTSFLSHRKDGLTIQVTGLRNNNGHVLVSLFDREEGFPEKQELALRKQQLEIKNRKAIAQFDSLPAGDYAIAILHDENNDAKMNSNWLGLPKEGYGFSNNVMSTFGPPSFNKAAFHHTAGSTTTITIITKY